VCVTIRVESHTERQSLIAVVQLETQQAEEEGHFEERMRMDRDEKEGFRSSLLLLP
jgi:hypothetical protein